MTYNGIFKKIENKEPIGIKQFVILFFSLVGIDVIIIIIIGVYAGLGQSATEIALAPLRYLLSFIIVVILPMVSLLLAVSYNQPDLVKLLLEYGANVYFVGEKKQTALGIARQNGFSRVEQLLLNHRRRKGN